MLFSRQKNGRVGATLDEAEQLVDSGRISEAVDLVCAANRADRDPRLARAARALRNQAGVAMLGGASGSRAYPQPATDLPAAGPFRVPEVDPGELSAEVLRASILEYGCLLVRGLVDPERAIAVAEEIERAYEVRESLGEGESDRDGYYDELQVEPPFQIVGRPWVGESGGMFAPDSPRVMCEMFSCLEDAGLKDLISDYLGESPVVSAEKCTLRRTTADLPKAWHQDGKFMGDVRALNLWLALSRCGDVSPGLDIVPRRIEEIQETGGEGTIIEIEVPRAKAEELAGPEGISRPIFDPGDALLFDDLFLHSTGSDESMTETRYAIESWFFAPSAFPSSYVPLAL